MVWACVEKRWWLGEEIMEYEVEGTRPRGRPKRTWREVVKKECQARKLNKEDAMDHSRWRKLIKDVWWSGWVWVGECFFLYWPTQVVPDKGPLNGCVCVILKCNMFFLGIKLQLNVGCTNMPWFCWCIVLQLAWFDLNIVDYAEREWPVNGAKNHLRLFMSSFHLCKSWIYAAVSFLNVRFGLNFCESFCVFL